MPWLIDRCSHPLDIHVMPLDDYRPHVPDTSCWCGPVLDEPVGMDEGTPVMVHHALDCRELYVHEGGHIPLH